jgi:hypothetical protein
MIPPMPETAWLLALVVIVIALKCWEYIGKIKVLTRPAGSILNLSSLKMS